MQSHGPSYKSEMREELKTAYQTLIDTMYKKAEQYVEDTKVADKFLGKAREHLRDELNLVRQYLTKDYTIYGKKRGGSPASAEQLAEFDKLADILVEGGNLETEFRYNQEGEERPTEGKPKGMNRSQFGRLMAGRHSNDTLDAINGILKAVRNRQGFNSESTGYLDKVRAAMNTYKTRMQMFKDAESGAEHTKKVPTSYAIEAKKMDQARTGDYWSEPHEMAARAFASYVEDKIAEQGGQSDFLVYHAHGGILLPMIDGFVARPYPEGKEREAINNAFNNFIGTIQTKETDKGTMMFQIGEEHGRMTEGGLFSGKDIEDVRNASDRFKTLAGEVERAVGRRLPEAWGSEVRVRDTSVTALERIAGVFGKEITFFRLNDPSLDFNGLVTDKLPQQIFINVDSKEPHLFVLGHELLHSLKFDRPDLYNKFHSYIEGEIRHFPRYKEWKSDTQKISGISKPPSSSLLREELFADFVGEQFLDKTFWDKLQAKDPSLFNRVIRFAKELIDRVLTAFKGNQNIVSSRFFKDIRKAQDTLANALKDYARQGGLSLQVEDKRRSLGERITREQQRFSDLLDAWDKGQIRKDIPIVVSSTPEVLERLGARQAPITITHEIFEKVVYPQGMEGGKHGIPIEVLKQLPKSLYSPIMIFASDKHGDKRLMVMTELTHRGKTIVAAIHLSTRFGKHVVNNIVTVHGKISDSWYLDQIKKGYLRYIDRNKSLEWARSRGYVAASKEATLSIQGSLNKTILTNEDIVKPLFDEDTSLQIEPFYSQLEKAVSELKQDKFTPDQLMGMLKGKVKEDEISQTGLREFLAEQGTERIVYRGNPSHIENFDVKEFKRGLDLGEGVLFTDSQKIAAAYDYEGKARPYSVDLENPFTVDYKGDADFWTLKKDIAYAKTEGYDGVIAKNIKDGKEGVYDITNHYFVFDPAKIKPDKQTITISKSDLLAFISEKKAKIVPVEFGRITPYEEFADYLGNDTYFGTSDPGMEEAFKERTERAWHNENDELWHKLERPKKTIFEKP